MLGIKLNALLSCHFSYTYISANALKILTQIIPQSDMLRCFWTGRKWGLDYNYILKTLVPKIEDFEPNQTCDILPVSSPCTTTIYIQISQPLNRFQNSRYIAEIKSGIIEQAEPNDSACLNVFWIIFIFLVLVFYRSRFSYPYQTYVQGYADHMKIDAFQCLNAYPHYCQLCFSY